MVYGSRETDRYSPAQESGIVRPITRGSPPKRDFHKSREITATRARWWTSSALKALPSAGWMPSVEKKSSLTRAASSVPPPSCKDTTIELAAAREVVLRVLSFQSRYTPGETISGLSGWARSASETSTSSSTFRNGRGRRSIASTTLSMVAVAAIPSESDSTLTINGPVPRLSPRTACLTSISMAPPILSLCLCGQTVSGSHAEIAGM